MSKNKQKIITRHFQTYNRQIEYSLCNSVDTQRHFLNFSVAGFVCATRATRAARAILARARAGAGNFSEVGAGAGGNRPRRPRRLP